MGIHSKQRRTSHSRSCEFYLGAGNTHYGFFTFCQVLLCNSTAEKEGFGEGRKPSPNPHCFRVLRLPELWVVHDIDRCTDPGSICRIADTIDDVVNRAGAEVDSHDVMQLDTRSHRDL